MRTSVKTSVGNALRGVPRFWCQRSLRNATEGVPYRGSKRRGISLLEVLAAIGVLSVGLFGLAALLPIGRYIISEAIKADQTGNCGRAAMRDGMVRRMLDFHHWYDPAQNKYVSDPSYNNNQPWFDPSGNPKYMPASFIIDPWGEATWRFNFLPPGTAQPTSPPPMPPLGGVGDVATMTYPTGVPRITLDYLYSNPPVPAPDARTLVTNAKALCDQIFMSADDLTIQMPEDMSPPQPVGRPQLPFANQPKGDYTWFLSVVASPNSATRFTVSIVICQKRVIPQVNLATQTMPAPVERPVTVGNFWDGGIGGGSILLDKREINDIATDDPPNPADTATLTAPGINPVSTMGINIKENDWVALCSATSGVCRWYRVASIGDNTQNLTLVGPDWIPSPPNANNPLAEDKLVALGQSVIGVYTTVIDLDTDPLWTN